LQEKQGTQGGSDSKTVGVHSKEIKKNEEKTQAQGHRPKPVPQVDPDHS